MMSLPALSLRRPAAALAGALLLLAGCGGGETRPILAPTVKASISQSPPLALNSVVFFDNISVVGDTIQMNAVVRDSTGELEVDAANLVLRYDATFIQVVSVTAQNAIFGTCGTVNLVCGLTSPVCLNNLIQANGGGEKYCRSNGSTPCATDDDCTAPGDKCGSFGRLLASFTVVTGLKVCANDPGLTCSTDEDCPQFCSANSTLACTTGADCSGTCDLNNLCTNLPTRGCVSDDDCLDDCVRGDCAYENCPSVVVSGAPTIASLTLRVMEEGTSSFRFVVSANPATPESALLENTLPLPITFTPSVDRDDPTILSGEIVITGNL